MSQWSLFDNIGNIKESRGTEVLFDNIAKN